MLTLSSQIPTMARGQVRAIVKAHPSWPAYLTEKNIISADARNVDLIELALRHPDLKAQIEQIIGPPHSIEEIAQLALEELRSSPKVRNLVEQIEQQLHRLSAGARSAPEELRRIKATVPKKLPKQRRTARQKKDDAALNNFNYVGSRHHY